MTSKCGKNKKVAHEAQPSVSLMFLRHFDVLCDLLVNRCTAKWNLFVLYNKEKLFYFQIFQQTQKAAFAFVHFGEHKKPCDVIYLLSICAKWSNFIGYYVYQQIVIGPGKSHHCQNLSSWNENLQRKQNWTAKSTNFKENAGKVKSIFVIRAALWAEKLGRCIKYCRSWENTLRKLCAWLEWT